MLTTRRRRHRAGGLAPGQLRVDAIALLALGVVLLGLIGVVTALDWQLNTRGVPTIGTVTAKTGGRDPQLRVRFRTNQGRQIEAETTEFTDQDPGRQVGQSVNIVYLPDDPAVFRTSNYETWVFPATMGAFALCCLAFAGWRLRSYKSRTSPRSTSPSPTTT